MSESNKPQPDRSPVTQINVYNLCQSPSAAIIVIADHIKQPVIGCYPNIREALNANKDDDFLMLMLLRRWGWVANYRPDSISVLFVRRDQLTFPEDPVHAKCDDYLLSRARRILSTYELETRHSSFTESQTVKFLEQQLNVTAA